MSNTSNKPATQKVKLLKPHEHQGTKYPVDAEIEVPVHDLERLRRKQIIGDAGASNSANK